jgi:hypothetical protein
MVIEERPVDPRKSRSYEITLAASLELWRTPYMG